MRSDLAKGLLGPLVKSYYNYDRQRYLGEKKSWATKMPKGYFDTNSLDAPNEINYAVGTSDARLLQSGRTYRLR